MKIFFHAWRISLNGRHQFVVSNSSRFQWNFPDLTIDSKNRKQAFNLILVKRQASNTMKQTRYFLGDSYFSNESTIHVWAWLILMAMSCVFVFKKGSHFWLKKKKLHLNCSLNMGQVAKINYNWTKRSIKTA